MIKYKAELLGIEVILQEESYTSKASALDLDKIPTFPEKANKFSGTRIKEVYTRLEIIYYLTQI